MCKSTYSSLVVFVYKYTIQSPVVNEVCNQISINAQQHNINKTRVTRVNYWWINMASSKWVGKLFMGNTTLSVCHSVWSIAETSHLMSCFKSHFKWYWWSSPSLAHGLVCISSLLFCIFFSLHPCSAHSCLLCLHVANTTCVCLHLCYMTDRSLTCSRHSAVFRSKDQWPTRLVNPTGMPAHTHALPLAFFSFSSMTPWTVR